MNDIMLSARVLDHEKDPTPEHARLLNSLEEAEIKAWDSLARYKFQMFGYWAAIWVHLNRIGDFQKPNPFSRLVKEARLIRPISAEEPRPLVQTKEG